MVQPEYEQIFTNLTPLDLAISLIERVLNDGNRKPPTHLASNANSIELAEKSPGNLVSDESINTCLRVRAEEIEAKALFKPNRSILLFTAYIKLLSYCKSHPIESKEHR